jgi:hypothetical protein
MDEINKSTVTNSAPLVGGSMPVAIKVVSWLMLVSGIVFILLGIPLMLIIGLGALYIVAGAFTIKYSQSILKLQLRGYKGALVMQGINVVLALVSWNIDGFNRVDYTGILMLFTAGFVVVVLQQNKKLFVN